MKEKKIAILQPNYIPWKGYFDLIRQVDLFVVYDTVQYTKNDWRNRNRVKTLHGPQWLSIPIRQTHLQQQIRDTNAANMRWPAKHWKTLKQSYGKAPGFREYGAAFEELYNNLPGDALLDINLRFIRLVCELLGIQTPIVLASDYVESCDRVERLVDLCRQLEATEYISGPSARSYIAHEPFEAAGVRLSWMDYSGYPVYPQLHGEFVHEVSILDLLFSVGSDAPCYLNRIDPTAQSQRPGQEMNIN